MQTRLNEMTTMLKRCSTAIAAVLLLAAAAFAAPAAPGKTPADAPMADAAALDARIDALLRSELFMTLGGIKPVSSTGPDAGTYKAVTEAVSAGSIRNPDILFFLDGDGPAMVSREAAARLIKDKAANEILRKYSLAMPRDAETWVSTFTACNADYFRSPFRCDLLFGMGYGYPPLEVEAYAADSAEQRKAIVAELSSDAELAAALARAQVRVPVDEEGWLRLQWQSTPGEGGPLSWQNIIYEIETRHKPSPRQTLRLPSDSGFKMPTYSRFTNGELERDGYYLRSVYILTRNYDALISSGRTPLEIINNPQWLKKGLPPFPEYFLTK